MTIDIQRTVNLDAPIVPETLRGALYQTEQMAHRFVITPQKGGATVNLTGAAISGLVMLADGQTKELLPSAPTPQAGVTADGEAWVQFGAGCYTVPGRFGLTIYATESGATTCIYACVGTISRTTDGSPTVPEGTIPTAAELAEMIDQVQDAIETIPTAVLYGSAQTLTDTQKTQARTNIGAADATEVSDLKSALTLNADYATVTPTINDTYTGVTCVYESENVIKLYGTSTAARRVLFLNGQNALRTSSQAFMQTVGAGEYDVSLNITGYLASNALSVQYTYTTFASAVTMVSLAVPTYHASLTQPAMVGLTFSTDVNFGTSDNPTYVEFHMTRTVSNDLLPPVDTDSTDETGKTDMAPAIMAMLKQTGHCHLGTGIYYVSGIDMPDNSMLSGCGKKTVVRLLQSVASGYCVKMTTHNTLSDICISGADAAPVRTSQGTRTGVLYAANHDGATDGATAYDTERCIIDNVWVENFTDSGLKCHNTASAYRKGLYATNLMLYACWCGLNIDYISEFNKFVNVQTAFCTYGCRNNGGNNTFTSCTFYGTSVAFYIDGTQPNAAHGALVGCTLCHSGSNTGSAITITGAANGFIISNCQIWYNTVNLTNSDGIVFSGCEFGRSADISISGGALVMFDGCVWMYDSTYPPVINVSNNNKVKFTGCYGAESGNAISA